MKPESSPADLAGSVGRYPAPVDREAQLNLWIQLAAERGAAGLDAVVGEIRDLLERAERRVRELPPDAELRSREPDDLEAIRSLRPSGRRRIGDTLDPDEFRRRLHGAFVGRAAGCTLGAPVELRPAADIERCAHQLGMEFPPTRYWTAVERPHDPAYQASTRREFTVEHMCGVPADDDIAYTLVGLLVLEAFGPGFTTDDVAALWQRVVPFAHTAERVTLANLRSGQPAATAADVDNPYSEMIGAGIRSDPWGYVAAGLPAVAAELAYRDASLTHRRNGLFAAMYFAATIAAAFMVDDPVEALHIGLGEIPSECRLARAVRWALDRADDIRDHRDAHDAVAEAFAGMHPVHSINNACLTVWGITIGGRDLTKVIGHTVAMGFDNDCTAATAGSIVGAVIGIDAIEQHWWRPFDDTVRTYLNGSPEFSIDDVIDRFVTQADRVRRAHG